MGNGRNGRFRCNMLEKGGAEMTDYCTRRSGVKGVYSPIPTFLRRNDTNMHIKAYD